MRPSILLLPLLLSLLAPLSGCRTAPPVSPTMSLPPDTAAVCATHCGSLGMDLGAVVIVRNSAGCVCQPRKAPASAGQEATTSGGSSAVVGGVAAVLDEEEAREERRRSDEDRQRRERSQPPPTGTSPGLPPH